MLVHSFGDHHFLPRGKLFRVENWNGYYVATYSTEHEANERARSIVGRYDARVIPIYS